HSLRPPQRYLHRSKIVKESSPSILRCHRSYCRHLPAIEHILEKICVPESAWSAEFVSTRNSLSQCPDANLFFATHGNSLSLIPPSYRRMPTCLCSICFWANLSPRTRRALSASALPPGSLFSAWTP